MSDTGGSTFRTALGYRPPPVQQTADEKLRDASKMYEKLFLNQMVKSMRSTVTESGFIKQNAAEKLFRDEMDQEMVNNWGNQQGGVGLADMIYNNLIDKYGDQLGITNPVQKPKGPLPMDAKSDYSGPIQIKAQRPEETTYRFDRNAQSSSEPGQLVAPWGGVLSDKKDLGEGFQLLEMTHDDGLSGRFVFRGTTDRLNVGQSINEGERIGLLSPESKSFFWTLALKSASGAEKPATVSE